MKKLPYTKPDGKCFICGESTQLEIHQECTKRKYVTGLLRKKGRCAKGRKHSENFLVAFNEKHQ